MSFCTSGVAVAVVASRVGRPIACQVGSICFDYYLTLCDADGQVYYVDMGCPAFDIEAAGFTECDAPAPLEVSCEA